MSRRKSHKAIVCLVTNKQTSLFQTLVPRSFVTGRVIPLAAKTDQVIRSTETGATLAMAGVSSMAVEVLSGDTVVESWMVSVEGPSGTTTDLCPSSGNAVIFAFEFKPASRSLEEPGIKVV